MKDRLYGDDAKNILAFVRIGCVLGWFLTSQKITIRDYASSGEMNSWPRGIQRVYWKQELGRSPNRRNNFVLLEGGSRKNARLWVAKVLLLSRMEVRRNQKEVDSTSVQ